MDDSKALFDYWHDRVRFKNEALIAAPGHLQTFELRHKCTNYDGLWQSNEVQTLEEPERSKVIAIIKYECTAKVLQRRSGLLRDRAQHYETAYQELNVKGSRLLKLIKALQEKLFGKDKEIEGLGARITSLVAENEALRAEVEKNDAYDALLKEFEQLRKQYEVVEKRKRELARNNQSLGGRVAHTNRYKQQRDGAIAEVRELKQQLQTLTGEKQQLQKENQTLRSDLGKLQKQNKLGIVKSGSMKLDELKTKVYALTGVTTTRQLKTNYPELKTLDLRRKASWEKALTIVQPADEFQTWLENPPEEYKELFDEIETASEAYSQQLAEVSQLGKEVTAIADNLEELASEYQDEADRMKQEVRATRKIRKQAQLN